MLIHHAGGRSLRPAEPAQQSSQPADPSAQQSSQPAPPSVQAALLSSRAVALLAHLLASSQAWLLRCEGESSAGVDLWPEVVGGNGLGPDAEVAENQVRLSSLEEAIDNNHRAWIKFLERESDFERMVHYHNQSNKAYSNGLSDLLSHVLNHGTHHRAQIGQLLKAEGLEKLPPMDYIAYLRMITPA